MVTYADRYYFQSHIFHCQIDDGMVLLDLNSERYIGLGSKEVSALAPFVKSLKTGPCNWTQDSPSRADAMDFVNHLIRLNILTCIPPQRISNTSDQCELKQDLLHHDLIITDRALRVVDIFRFIRACAFAAFMLKTFTLKHIIDLVRRRKANQLTSISLEEVGDLGRLFLGLRPFAFSGKNNCLYESLALLLFLSQYNVFPVWVIGVQTHPFLAHSWVSHNGLLLTGEVEMTKHMSPILAV